MQDDTALFDVILNGRHEAVEGLIRSALEQGLTPDAILHERLLPGMEELGRRYASGQAVIPDLLLGARAMQAGLDALEPLLPHSKSASRPAVCIGTVQGDRHGIGKNIVAMRLRAAGYRVTDLGVDCGAEAFLRAVDKGARAVLCSALMTRSLRYLRVVADAFRDRPEIPMIIGGAPVTPDFAAELGAGYAPDASSAVQALEAILQRTELNRR
ncbi:MAG: B12-binding domain-containing protein [Kiritimatiellae bacterium]|nr:B12-binding domain-containing protein [Kiritimatiellia bacterium]